PLLRSSDGGAVHQQGDRLLSVTGDEIGRIEDGILRIPVASVDEGIAFYRKLGGAHFHERAAMPFAMSVLDTPIYHSSLDAVRPASSESVIVDVGGGDGRNARPWLERGFRRLVVIDAAGEALLRFRRRIAEERADWLEHLLLIEADARKLPLADGCAAAVLAIETLGCLNEDYVIGLGECARLLASVGKLLVSERGYEGGLVMRLLYYGIDGMLQSAESRALWDGPPGAPLRTRCFSEAE